jgi:hypothetical protein
MKQPNEKTQKSKTGSIITEASKVAVETTHLKTPVYYVQLFVISTCPPPNIYGKSKEIDYRGDRSQASKGKLDVRPY